MQGIIRFYSEVTAPLEIIGGWDYRVGWQTPTYRAVMVGNQMLSTVLSPTPLTQLFAMSSWTEEAGGWGRGAFCEF